MDKVCGGIATSDGDKYVISYEKAWNEMVEWVGKIIYEKNDRNK